MRKIINIILAVAISLAFSSCYFEDDTTVAKSDISKIKLSSDFTELTFGAMEVPNFGVKVEQTGEKKELHYEWAYGKLNKEDYGYFIDGDIEVISNDSLLKFRFPYLGEYGLRLIVDNGEDVQEILFKLTISAGYDEGLAILTKDEQNNGYLAFLKTLTPQDSAEGVKPKVISDFFTDFPINDPKSIHSPKNKAVCISDGDGRIVVLNQQTMAVDMVSHPPQIAGKSADVLSSYYYSSSGNKLGCFCFTSDKKVYRFDALLGEMFTMKMTKNFDYSYEDIDAEQLLKTDGRFAFFINYTKSMIWNPYGSRGYFKDYSEDYSILAVGYPNTSGSYIYMIAKPKDSSDSYVVLRDDRTLKRLKKLKTYTFPAESTINKDTRFINSNEYDDFLYYTYKNKIYRWDYKHQGMPEVGSYLPFDIPADEQIVKILFNGDKKGTQLFVCTYSSSRPGKLKGSIYVYHPDRFNRLDAFEGTIHKVVDLIYKTL